MTGTINICYDVGFALCVCRFSLRVINLCWVMKTHILWAVTSYWGVQTLALHPTPHPSPLFFPSAETKPISQGHYQRWHRNLKCWGGTCVRRFSPLTFSGLVHVVGCWWPANCACHFSTLIQACLPPYPACRQGVVTWKPEEGDQGPH